MIVEPEKMIGENDMNYKEMFIQEETGLHGKTEYRVHRIKENGEDDPTPWTYAYRETAISYIVAHSIKE